MPNAITTAEILAVAAHSGETYAGKPYVRHPMAVAKRVSEMVYGIPMTDAPEVVVAILHDVVEDSDVEVEDIDIMFGKDIADAVEAITKRPSEDYLSEYIPRVAFNSYATVVKIADLMENLSHTETLKPKNEAKYLAALEKLASVAPPDELSKKVLDMLVSGE